MTWRDLFCRRRHQLLDCMGLNRSWFRDLSAYYRGITFQEFWVPYTIGRMGAPMLAGYDPSFSPEEGRITIDGVDLRELSQDSYRRLFGVVSQEALLFNTTVRENITYGREGITDDAVVRAARLANANDFILELPQGYDTVVGDRGIRLSGGQRQRIAIARAIVTDPPLLVLDEAPSFLDAEAERLVQEAIERITKRTTTIVIAHRLSTILRSDKIVVLSDRRVEAIGRHDELMSLKGTYARLFDLSASQG